MEDRTFGPPQTPPAAPPAAPHNRNRGRVGIALAAVAVAAAAFGVTSIASAATNSAATPTPTSTATAPLPGNPDGNGPDGNGPGGPIGPGGTGRFGGRGHLGGPGMGMPGMGGPGIGGALHGEFVVHKADVTYQTVGMQAGDVTAVSTSSITVKSVDGFSKSYDVTAATIVNAARDGIASVKVGDTVHLDATVAGGKGTAVDVIDETTLKASGQQWHMGRKGAAATPLPSASSA